MEPSGMPHTRRQIAAMPFVVRDGKVEVLLQTSRETGRWIIPKGNIEPGQTPETAALAEAFEEAGVSGVLQGALPIGFFNYLKRTSSGEKQPVTVEVFLMRVTKILTDWPERAVRERQWVLLADAAGLVQEPSIAPLFERLAELEHLLIAGDKENAPNES
jgi:8-oxo-dGTP pyrophosphatase MutT (NUDIX family)